MIFYYSGCGNSRHVAECLAEAENEQLEFIPQALREGNLHFELSEGECVGFVFPIYSWRPPQLVLDFVGKLQLEGVTPYVYMVATYGDDSGLADKVLAQALEVSGLRLDAAYGVTMPNTYVNMAFMNVDSPEVEKRKLEQAKVRLERIAEAVKERRKTVDLNRGAMPGLKTNGIGKGFVKWVSDKKYLATDACVGCGICAKVCPLQNIVIEGGKPRWNGNCNHCEACYHYCPQNAVQYGKVTRGKGQYHFAR